MTLAISSTPSVEGLRQRLSGSVITEGDPGFEAERLGFNLVFEHQAPIVVLAETADDVAEAVRFAAGNGLGVAVKATGHGFVATGTDAVLVVTSRMVGVEIDPTARTARIAAGAKWGDVLAVAQEHGLTPLLGSTTDVGAVGYTIGGGIGWLSRQHGMAADHVRSFEVVTATGEIVQASADSHPDLFWAIRGGGAGSLGVVTAMEIGLFPVRTVYGGNLLYPSEMAAEVVRRYRQWIESAPEALTSSIALMNYPPLEVVPEPVRGRSFVIVRGAFDGPADRGADLLGHFRDWEEPMIDTWAEIPMLAVNSISQDPVDPMGAVVTSDLLAGLSDELIDALVDQVFAAGSPIVFAEARHMGGAIARPGVSTLDRYRAASHVLEVVAAVPVPEMLPMVESAVAALRAAISSETTGGAYLNFLEGEEKQSRTRSAFTPEAYARLRELKRLWDPSGVFRFGIDLS